MLCMHHIFVSIETHTNWKFNVCVAYINDSDRYIRKFYIRKCRECKTL